MGDLGPESRSSTPSLWLSFFSCFPVEGAASFSWAAVSLSIQMAETVSPAVSIGHGMPITDVLEPTLAFTL